MDELAALTTTADPAAFMLPPVSDLQRDDEFVEQEHRVAAAEAALAASRWDDVIEILSECPIAPGHLPDLALRALLAESWARMYRGELDRALELLQTAKRVAHRPGFNDIDRAEVLFRIGCVRLKRSAVSRAVNDLTLALELCERSGRPCDPLRAKILEWRSQCYEWQRDFAAARSDVEHALELADATGDRRTAAHVNFRASVIAERNGQWLLARFYAENAKDLYGECGDEANVGRLLSALGGLDFRLGKPDEAVANLTHAVAIALETGSEVDAAAAVAFLAEVHLSSGEPVLAEPHARHALELLGARADASDEIGKLQVVLGRSLLEQGRLDEAASWFAAAEASSVELGSTRLRAAAWLARGDLAAARGDVARAAALFRQAADVLQDSSF
jgi:tetratricopeptide (TPR) repeat protein